MQSGEVEKQIEVQNLISKLEIGQGDNSLINKEQIKTSYSNATQSNTPVLNEDEITMEQIKTNEEQQCNNAISNEDSKTTSNDTSKTALNEDQNKTPKSNDEKTKASVTVMVLGAGRGPLVRATFNASDITNTKVKVRQQHMRQSNPRF